MIYDMLWSSKVKSEVKLVLEGAVTKYMEYQVLNTWLKQSVPRDAK